MAASGAGWNDFYRKGRADVFTRAQPAVDDHGGILDVSIAAARLLGAGGSLLVGKEAGQFRRTEGSIAAIE